MKKIYLALVLILISSVFNHSSGKPKRYENKYDDIIKYYSSRHLVDPFLVKAVIKAESNFNCRSVSCKKAKGLMQLMPCILEAYYVNDPFDPVENIRVGSQHLATLLYSYNGDIDRALAAYNAGSQMVEKYKGCPPFKETREYVRYVKKVYSSYKSKGFISRKRVYSFTDSKGHMYFYGE